MLGELFNAVLCIICSILFYVVCKYSKQIDDLKKEKASSDEIIEKQKNELEAVKSKQEKINIQGSQESRKDEQYIKIPTPENENFKLKTENARLKNQIGSLEKYINELKQNANEIRNEHRKQLEFNGKLCSKNCALCTILWSCQKKLKVHICGLQLMLTILHHAGKINDPIENLKCEKSIQLFLKAGVVEVLKDGKFDWSGDAASTKQDGIQKAVNTITNTADGVVYLVGLKIPAALGGGHAIACEVSTENGRKKFLFADLQNWWEEEFTKSKFKKFLENERIVGVTFNIIKEEKLEYFINGKYKPIMHHTDGRFVSPTNDCTITIEQI